MGVWGYVRERTCNGEDDGGDGEGMVVMAKGVVMAKVRVTWGWSANRDRIQNRSGRVGDDRRQTPSRHSSKCPCRTPPVHRTHARGRAWCRKLRASLGRERHGSAARANGALRAMGRVTRIGGVRWWRRRRVRGPCRAATHAAYRCVSGSRCRPERMSAASS